MSVSNNAQAGSIAGYKQKSGYVAIKVSDVLYYAHRLAFLYMTGKFPSRQADHKDHIRHNNKWENLKEATLQENGKNRSLNKNNKSGVMGVCWKNNGWECYIKINGKNKYLGRYTDYFEAVCARKSADYEYGFHENHGR